MAFGVWDYVVFIVMLVISAGIGIYVRFSGGRQKTTEEYLLADRSMPIWPVSFSLMASFMSAITLLGVSNEVYQFGTQFIVINVAYGLATPIAAYLFLPVFYKMQATSAYEYLEKRFGKATRLAASISYSLQMILYMGIVLYAPALALEAVTGMSKTFAILLIGFVCAFYSTIGGMKAVLLTDVFQSGLMFASIFSVVISGLIYAGGFKNIFKAAADGGRLELWNFDMDPTTRHSWFSLVIGGAFTYLTLYGVNQTQIQRLMTVKSLRAAQLALWWNWPILSALSITTSFSGLVIYYFYKTCDPMAQGRGLTSRDQNMPIYVIDALGHIPGLSGLFVSGIFSASLSSVSACLNSLAAVTVEDYFKPLYLMIKKKPWDIQASKSALPSKIIAGFYGLLCIGVAFLAQNLGGVLQASLTIFGVVGGPLLGVFTLGMFTQTANQVGAVTGLFFGIVLSMWTGFGGPKPPPPYLHFSTENCTQFGANVTISKMTVSETLDAATQMHSGDTDNKYFYLYRLSYMYAVVLGFLITTTVGYLVSNLLRLCNMEGESKIYVNDNTCNINADLFVPPIAKRIRKRNAKNEDLLGNRGGDISIKLVSN